MKERIEGKYTYRGIWQVAYPILISLFMEQMIGMTDTAFLGRVGEIELGASAIAGVYYMVIFIVGFGFSIGSQIIIGRRNGEGKYTDTGKIFWHGLYFLLGFAAVMIALSEALSPWLMSKMVSSDKILDAALTYVRWRILGLFFAWTTAMFRAFYIGTMQTKTLTLNSIVMVLSNVVFNWILIYGKLGFPALGIAGAAIGSTLAELVSLIFFLVYTATRTDTRKFGLHRPAKFEWKELKVMFNISVWTMIENFLSVSTWFIFFLFVEHLGERSLAVSNIVRNVSGLIWVVLMAFSSTCSTLVSNMIGAGEQDRVPGLIGRVMKMGYGHACDGIVIPHQCSRQHLFQREHRHGQHAHSIHPGNGCPGHLSRLLHRHLHHSQGRHSSLLDSRAHLCPCNAHTVRALPPLRTLERQENLTDPIQERREPCRRADARCQECSRCGNRRSCHPPQS